MKQWQVLRTVFPEVITENFEFTDYVEEADRLEYWGSRNSVGKDGFMLPH